MATTISGSSNSSFGGTIDSTGIDDNATSTAVTLDSSGNVGIGTSIPGAKLQVVGSSNTDVALLGTAGTRLTINTDDSIGEVKLKVEDPSGNNYAKFMTFHTEGGSGTTERLRILSSGGITFNGDTAAANALDDYEEGTFTLSMTATTPPTNIPTTTARYTKIGNVVTVSFDFSGNTTGASGDVKLTGLPYISNGIQAGSMLWAYSLLVDTPSTTYIEDNGTTIHFITQNSGGFTDISPSTESYVRGTIVYHTD